MQTKKQSHLLDNWRRADNSLRQTAIKPHKWLIFVTELHRLLGINPS